MGEYTPDATSVYQGAGGALYWQRNKERVLAAAPARRGALRGLIPDHRLARWLELGCGVGANLCSGDVGVDCDARALRQMRPGVIAVHHAILPHGVRCFLDHSFQVVLSVGLLMHFQDELARRVVSEMARLSGQYVITGEYEAAQERDLLWNPETGEQGTGPTGLLWERPYAPLMDTAGLTLLSSRQDLPGFEARVTFSVWRRKEERSEKSEG